MEEVKLQEKSEEGLRVNHKHGSNARRFWIIIVLLGINQHLYHTLAIPDYF